MNAYSSNDLLTKIDDKIYYPQADGLDGFCVKVFSKELQDFVQDKIMKSSEKKFIYNLCWGEKTGAKIETDYEIKSALSESAKAVEEVLFRKKGFIIPTSFKEQLGQFSIDVVSGKNGNMEVKASSEDVTDVNEYYLYLKNYLPTKIIMKKPVGTTTMNLKWKKFKFTSNKFVLERVDTDKREGTQNIKSTIIISYTNFVKSGLPNKLSVSSEQILLGKTKGVMPIMMSRKSAYDILFEGYQLRYK